MKDKAPHAFAGWTLGIACYAVSLFCFDLLGPGPSAYWMLPLPNSLNTAPPVSFLSRLQNLLFLWWDFHRLELIVVSTGLGTPIGFAARAWSRPNPQRTLLWRRWDILLILVGVNLAAAALIAYSIYFILPFHPLWLW